MAQDLNDFHGQKKKTKLIMRLLIPMLLLVLFQLVTLFTVLIAGGEFSTIKQYAYSILLEKTENRKNYLESELQQKIPIVSESAEKINDMVSEILYEQHRPITDLQQDKELNKLIINNSVEDVISLLRRSMSNDAYIILDSGNLYDSESGKGNAKTALYIRDLDPATDSGKEDLLMEMGFSSISQQEGIALDSGWTLHFESDPADLDRYGYYYNTVENAQKNCHLDTKLLGYWSGFSPVTRGSSSSMKYTVPLIANDGTVYGVIGIGLTENTILEDIPVNDFLNEEACYVLGRRRSSSEHGNFDVITHSGVAYNHLVQGAKTLQVRKTSEEDIYSFDLESNIASAGSVQYIKLYESDSPYADERWSLISIADKESVLKLSTGLIRMLFVAAAISLTISVVVIIIVSRKVVEPISDAIKTINTNHEYSQVIRFEPSNIYELDMMTDAITQLQINVQDFSSQVSKMIRIADVGLGTFMYDHADNSVFVGQSLLKFLRSPFPPDEDVVLSRQAFIENIIAYETRSAIIEGFENMSDDSKAQSDYVKEYTIAQEDGNTIWMRLSLVHNKNKSVGILQDITNVMMEKKRIEYERDYDAITGLLNRHAYYRAVEKLFRNKSALKVTAFIMLDLDNLKYVNDTYGHDFGDDYIKTAATALKNFRRYGAIVSRLSGDEFNICLPGFSSKDEARRIINRVRTQLLNSYCLLADGTHFRIRASAGIAWYPDDSETYEMLMKYADFAMYTIKHSTKGEIAEFDMAAYAKDSVLINGVEEMNRIIDECSIKYAFHSIVSAKTGEIYGYEALMRPQSTILQSPMELLRIAKTGAKLYEIERLTWVRALHDFQVQINEGRISNDCHVFVNSISNCVLEDLDADVLERDYPQLLPKVVLEILEGENMNEEYNTRKLSRIKKWGGQIALDDFGTGYNSEYALITIEPNIIKIDRSIISGCDKDMSRRMIISNLVRLVRHKNILVLAEGVETEGELRTVISLGVDLLQGYYINRPVFEPAPIPSEVTDAIRRFANKINY